MDKCSLSSRAVLLATAAFAGLAIPTAVSAQTFAPGKAAAQAPLEPAGNDGSVDRPAAATPPTEAVEPGLSEIVVTAQKRAESLQDVPLSITALGDEELKARGVTGVTDLLSGAVPSLRVTSNAGRTSNLSITMRGINPGAASNISQDGSVGIYIDGIYLGRVHGLGAELLDLERMEVLRGPQGTLFGRNALAGAVNLVSKKPSGEFELDQTFGVRNYGGVDAVTHLNLPRFGNVSLKLDGVFKDRDGWVDNPLAGEQDWAEYKKWGVRASALWEPADGISFLYSFEKSRDESTPFYVHLPRLLPGAPMLAPLFHLEPHRVRTARVGVPLDFSVGKITGHSLNAEWQVAEGLLLRSITGYRKLTQSQDDNFAGSFFAFRPNGDFGRRSFALVDQDQFSQELQVVGDTKRLKYVLGAFYFEEDASEGAGVVRSNRFNADGTASIVLPEPLLPALRDRASVNRAESLAFFGQATYTPPLLGDRLHVTAGLRHTEDKKNGRLTFVANNPSNLNYKFNSGVWTYLATAAYDWTENVNTYLRYSTGYRAGGANSRSPKFGTFGPEKLHNWELGLKSELFDRRVRLNVALFDMKYDDLQFGFTNLTATPIATEIVNALETIKIRGAEIDLTAVPVEGLTLNASYSYLDTGPLRLTNPFDGTTVSQPSLLSPKHAASGAVDYEFSLFGKSITAHADAIYSSGFFSNSLDTTDDNAYTLINTRLKFEDVVDVGGGSLSLSLWSKNLFNRSPAKVACSINSRSGRLEVGQKPSST